MAQAISARRCKRLIDCVLAAKSQSQSRRPRSDGQPASERMQVVCNDPTVTQSSPLPLSCWNRCNGNRERKNLAIVQRGRVIITRGYFNVTSITQQVGSLEESENEVTIPSFCGLNIRPLLEQRTRRPRITRFPRRWVVHLVNQVRLWSNSKAECRFLDAPLG